MIKLDMGMIDALAIYISHGLEPGSFGMALLVQDRELAYLTAHELLKPTKQRPDDIVANMLWFTKTNTPPVARGTERKIQKWMAHKGAQNPPMSFSAWAIERKLKGIDAWWERKRYD
jgi:hypothetical protein